MRHDTHWGCRGPSSVSEREDNARPCRDQVGRPGALREEGKQDKSPIANAQNDVCIMTHIGVAEVPPAKNQHRTSTKPGTQRTLQNMIIQIASRRKPSTANKSIPPHLPAPKPQGAHTPKEPDGLKELKRPKGARYFAESPANSAK